jgi:hypothetical protein
METPSILLDILGASPKLPIPDDIIVLTELKTTVLIDLAINLTAPLHDPVHKAWDSGKRLIADKGHEEGIRIDNDRSSATKTTDEIHRFFLNPIKIHHLFNLGRAFEDNGGAGPVI